MKKKFFKIIIISICITYILPQIILAFITLDTSTIDIPTTAKIKMISKKEDLEFNKLTQLKSVENTSQEFINSVFNEIKQIILRGRKKQM